jgi:hypothetical protein
LPNLVGFYRTHTVHALQRSVTHGVALDSTSLDPAHYASLPLIYIVWHQVGNYIQLNAASKKIRTSKSFHQVGKHVKATFPSSEHKSKDNLDLVHSQVGGLMSMASILGRMY